MPASKGEQGQTLTLCYKVSEEDMRHIETAMQQGECSNLSKFTRDAVGRYCTMIADLHARKIRPAQAILDKQTNPRGKVNRLAAKRLDVDIAIANAHKEHIERMNKLSIERAALDRLIGVAVAEAEASERVPATPTPNDTEARARASA